MISITPRQVYTYSDPLLSMEPWAAAKKAQTSVAVSPSPVRVSSQRPLTPSGTSVANDKDDNEIIPGAVHRSPGICLMAEETPKKCKLRDSLMKWLCNQSSPQIGSLSSKCR